MARGFDSLGNEVEVAYDTRALMISRNSSRLAGSTVEVADSTTRDETRLMTGGKRCKARCCRIGDGVGAELLVDGSGRKEAASKVEIQCTAVKPT